MMITKALAAAALFAVTAGAGEIATLSSAPQGCAPMYTFTGEVAGDRFGRAVSFAGDVDNDGYEDVIVGSHLGGGGTGRAYVYSGQSGELLWTFSGEAVGDQFGQAISGAGDVNMDGYDDVIVGALFNDGGGSNAGRAYVYSGETGELLWTFTGEAASDWLGHSVSGAGDVDNDGYADLIVGATRYDSAGVQTLGRAYVYSGQTGGVLWKFNGEAADDNLGHSVSGAGDVDNDGYADLIVGAPKNDAGGNNAGRAYVYSGQTGELLWAFTGEGEGDYLGYYLSVSGAGDVDNDGHADLIVAGIWNDAGGSDAGRAYVYSGQMGELLWKFTGEAAGDYLGVGVSGAGDIDSDGYADVIIGAHLNDAGGIDAGRAYVYSGQTGELLWTFTGAAAGDALGHGVSGGGDANGDGFPDLVIGASLSDLNGTDAGSAYVFSCYCAYGCPFQCDFDEDGFITAIDLGNLIDVLFAGGVDPQDPLCPGTRGDFDCDGFTTALDLGGLIDHLFAGGPPPCDPCNCSLYPGSCP